jgi:hypothetical protein
VTAHPEVATIGRPNWHALTAARRIAASASAVGIVTAAILPDFFDNVGLLRPMALALVALVAVLLLTTRRPRPGVTELGLGLLCLAALWPGLGHGQLAIPGSVLFIAACLGLGRMSGLKPTTICLVLLAGGAIMGALAVVQTIPAISTALPFEPMRHGHVYNTLRATGFFNNPNTLGWYEATAFLMAAVFGLPWDQAPTRIGRSALATLTVGLALCFVGLGLSGSRESIVGLLIGLAVLAAVRRGGLAPRRQVVAPVAVALGLAVVVVLGEGLVTFPVTPGRYNPVTMAADTSLSSRFDGWRQAVELIVRKPLLGYGSTLPMKSIDDVYLEWLLSGGVIGLALWLGGLAVVVPRGARPFLAAALAIGTLANPLAVGPMLAILLIACGLVASQAPPAEPEPAKA